jgi:hypothetical protein
MIAVHTVIEAVSLVSPAKHGTARQHNATTHNTANNGRIMALLR